MTRFGWEKLADILAAPNFRDMLIAYNEELNPIPDVARIDPDWPEMLRREEAGIFRVWAARVDRTLAGFVSFQVFPHLNFRNTLFAMDAGFYLSPAYRQEPGRLGYRMWHTAEIALKELGVEVILAHDNALHPLLPLFLGLGYKPRSVIYLKVITP